ncbi:MAG TPA: hypothetical protein VFZ65_09575 [Planctomycetota bacterium]|nr:hypothetical protein [Planctomycetota bacterium]
MLRSAMLAVSALVAIAPTPAQNCFDTLIGTDLNLGDDDTAQGLSLGFPFTYAGVTYTSICVCSNGYIWLGPTSVAGGDYTPTEAELLSGAPRICPLWDDFNPAAFGSGHVYYDNSTPGIAKITWAGVFEFGSTNPVDMQVVLDAGSNIKITYGTNAAIGGSLLTAVIIGASPGGGASSNPVSFATRPVTFTSNNFAEVIPANGTGTIPYSGFQMQWTRTPPAGYVVSDNPCTQNPLPGPAAFELVGDGCPGRQGPALYEVFGAGANTPDLSGLNLSLLPTTPTEYIALPGLFPNWFTGFSNNLNMSDDQSLSVALPFAFPYDGGMVNSIYVSSNGFLTLGTTDPGSGCCSGDVGTLLSGPPRVCAWWADLYPPGGGGVYADLDPSSGDFVVTWNQVPEYFSGPPQTCQIALNPTGVMTIRWVNVSAGGHTWLAGYSGGNNTPDPGPVDLSAVNGTLVSSIVVQPLELDAVAGSLPQVGGTFQLEVRNIAPSPNGVLALLFVCIETPGIPLDVLGLTGCTAYISLPELYSSLNLTLGSPSTTFSVPIPPSPAYYGVQVMSQAISDDLTANPFGFRVSNGGRWTFGL